MLCSLLLLGLLAMSSALNLPGPSIDLTASDMDISATSDTIAKVFAEEYMAFQKSGVESVTLQQLSKQLAGIHTKKGIFTQTMGEWSLGDQFLVCTTCRATVNVMGRMFRDEDGEMNNPQAEENSKEFMLYICNRLDIQTQQVCAELFDLNWPYLEYILHNTTAESRSLCGMLPITFCDVKQEDFNWSLNITEGQSPDAPKDNIPAKVGNELKVLQLSDIHYDPEYKPYSSAECDEPLCCRYGAPTETEKQAGYWGDYRSCDSPLHTLEDAFDQMLKTHGSFDYIYHSGDIVPHNVWSTTKDGNVEIISVINSLLEKKFPGIPVYPCVGNHETHPTNIFGSGDNVPEPLNVKWLYEHLYKTWSKWLPADTKDTILKGGYYSVSPRKGFRVISLNDNDCYLLNWWLYLNGSIGIEQLQWLHDTLLSAEQNNEYVHILGHIPSGNADCWPVWAREFNRIVERFSPIINGIFTSHTHKDELKVHYTSKGYAMQVTWIAGSMTSFSYKNPNYRVYHVEPEKMQVVDHETWILNLTAANEAGEKIAPVWYKEYQFSEEFTDNLSPAGIDTLLDEMAEKPSLLRKYWRFKITTADPFLDVGCDNKCLLKLICDMSVSVRNEKQRCKELQKKLKESLANEPLDKPEEDGATTIYAFSMTSLFTMWYLIHYFF